MIHYFFKIIDNVIGDLKENLNYIMHLKKFWYLIEHLQIYVKHYSFHELDGQVWFKELNTTVLERFEFLKQD